MSMGKRRFRARRSGRWRKGGAAGPIFHDLVVVLLMVLMLTSTFAAALPRDKVIQRWRDTDRDYVGKVILGEMFTATWCTPCVNADAGMDLVLDDDNYFDQRFVLVQYHVNDDYSFAEGDDRIDYYWVSSIPTVIFDGQDTVVGSQGDPEANEAVFKQHIDASGDEASVSMTSESSINDDEGEVTTIVTVENPLPWTPVGLTLYGYLVEDEDVEFESGHILRMTARTLMYKTSGIRIRGVGESIAINATFKIESGWARKDLAIVSWLQNDNSKEVLQATISYPEISGTGPVNNPPQYIGGDIDFSMEEDSIANHIILENLFDDMEDDRLTYRAEGTLNINVSVDQGSTTLNVAPGPDWSGTETIYVSANDGTHPPTSHPVKVTVIPVNDPPRIKGRLTGLIFDEDTSSVTSPISSIFEDPDGDEMTFQIENMVHLLAFKNKDQSLTITAQENWNGYEELVIKASDSEYETVYDDTIRVNPVNDPPEIRSFYPEDWMEVDEGGELTLSVSASDIEGNTLTYNWEVDGVPDIVKSASFKYEPAFGDSGEHVILVKVSDGSDFASHAFHVIVVEGNRAPTVRITSPLEGQTFEEGDIIVFTSEVDDPDDPRGRYIDYQWTIDGEPMSIEPQFTSKLSKGSHTVVLTVSDTEYEVKDSLVIIVEGKKENGVPGFQVAFVLAAVLFVVIALRRR